MPPPQIVPMVTRFVRPPLITIPDVTEISPYFRVPRILRVDLEGGMHPISQDNLRSVIGTIIWGGPGIVCHYFTRPFRLAIIHGRRANGIAYPIIFVIGLLFESQQVESAPMREENHY